MPTAPHLMQKLEDPSSDLKYRTKRKSMKMGPVRGAGLGSFRYCSERKKKKILKGKGS
jgi:hypothetical protein